MGTKPVSGRPRPWRRHYLVNKSQQGPFIVLLAGAAVLAGVAAGAIVYTVVRGVLEESLWRSHLATGSLWELIRPSLISANTYVSTASILVAIAAVSVVLRRSSRVLLAIESEVSALDGRDPAGPSPLDRTEWRETFRSAANGLKVRLRPFADAADRLEEAVDRWEATSQEGPPPAKELMRELESAIGAIDECLGKIEC